MLKVFRASFVLVFALSSAVVFTQTFPSQAYAGCGGTGSITSNFNGTKIAGGNYIWFSSAFKASGVTGVTTIRLTGQTLNFTASDMNGNNPTEYNLSLPDSEITFNDGGVTQPTTSFDSASNTWETRLSGGPLSGNTFLSALAFQIPPGGFKGGVNPVKWSGDFQVIRGKLQKLDWQWAAAVYTKFTGDHALLDVKPVDVSTRDYPNSDHAGTPENFKQFVTGGARGGGGSNFTGSFSGT